MCGYDLGLLSKILQFHKHLNLFSLALSLPPLIGWEKLALTNPIFFCNFFKNFFFPWTFTLKLKTGDFDTFALQILYDIPSWGQDLPISMHISRYAKLNLFIYKKNKL